MLRQLALNGTLPVSEARLYLSITEKARAFIEKYFHLTVPLYFHYTHLVCRTALDSQYSSGLKTICNQTKYVQQNSLGTIPPPNCM